MKIFAKILLLISLLVVYQCLNSQNLEKKEHYIYAKSVTIVDSAFMDLVVRTLNSDSIKKLLSFAQIEKYLKDGFVNIEIQERPVFKTDSVYPEYLNESIKIIINNNDNLTQVVVTLSDFCINLSKYVTKYKEYRFFFNKLEFIGGQDLFKNNTRIFKYSYDIYDFDKLWTIRSIPFILYDNELYIEPEEIQWFMLYE